MSVTILQTGLTGMPLARITHKERLTFLTLFAHRVVMTLKANVQAAARLTIGVSIAQTLNAAILTHIAKVTFTLIGTHTTAANTSLTADWKAAVVLGSISGRTDALVAWSVCVQINALL